MTDVIRPGDDGWDSARHAWNLVADQQPAMVALPTNASEVAEAIQLARENGLRVAVQAGGHNAVALGPVGEDTLLLKTLRMTDSSVDAGARRARAGAGAKWRDIGAPASAEGLAPLVGSSAEVGVAGFTLGGGLGWLGRKWGLACNSVTSIELVTADGEVVRVDHDNEPDLFWALRGGGGSFGAVTEIEMELYPVPELYAGAMLWPWERSEEIIHAWREWIPGQPDEVSGCVRILQLPPIPDIPEPFRGRNLVGFEIALLGDEAAGAELVKPMRDLGPEFDLCQAMPPDALGYIHMDPEDPVPGLSGHQMLDDFPAEAVGPLLEAAGPGSDSHLLSVELRQLGGALAREAPDAGALPGLSQDFVMFSVGMPMTPEMGEAIHAANEAVTNALEPWDSGVKYGNFTEAPTDSRMCYAPAAYDRLQDVKLRYDADDLFRSNHPIPCAAAA
jgi:hypothetical protein